jgi:hypothetical protein
MARPDHGTRSLSLTLRRADDKDAVVAADEERRAIEMGRASEDAYSDYMARVMKATNVTANLGFTKSDWEIGNKDDWWIEFYLGGETFDALVEAVRQNRAHHVWIGSKWLNLYVTDFHAPPSVGVRWYLPPSHHKDWSDTGYGYLSSVSWSETPIVLSDEEESRSESAASTETPEKPDLTALALREQAATLKIISKSLQWLLGLMAAIVVLLLFLR